MKRFIIFLLLLPALLLADRLVLKGGNETLQGAILKADSAHIYIQINDSTTRRIAHQDVASVFFRYADRLQTLSGDKIVCKVLSEDFPNLRIVTAVGKRLIRLIDLKWYFQEDADSLTILALPPTGPLFKNERILATIRPAFRQHMFIGFSGGMDFPPSNKWQEEFLTGSSPATLNGQVEVGLALFPSLSVRVGFSHSRFKDVAASGLGNIINTQYYFAGVLFKPMVEFFPASMSVSLGSDIGLLDISGQIYTFSYRYLTLDNLSPNVAVRPFVEWKMNLSDRVSVLARGGYMFSQKFNVKSPAECNNEIYISVNGLIITAGFTYQFPVQVW
ncbi:MAG: hypothetical protein E4H13_00745 [Calditrichales bacterium]|nr:MAG: hypothetical protein E4H13_00745 [Calditrichales bacterium]